MNFSHNNLDSVFNIAGIQSPMSDALVFDFSYNNIKYFSCTSLGFDDFGGQSYHSAMGFLNLSNNPNLFLPSDAFTIAHTSGAGAHSFPAVIDLSNCNSNSIPELLDLNCSNCTWGTAGTTSFDIRGNNIYCLPKLPSTIDSIFIDTAKITCVPNGGTYTINGVSAATYPVCNPTNNISGCKGYPTFIGSVYLDENNNGVKDASEIYLDHFPVQWGNDKTIYTDNNGNFSISADTIGQQTINFIAPQYYTAFPSTFSYDFLRYDTTVSAGSIGVRLTTVINSAAIYITPLNNCARPGFDYSYQVNYTNTGTTTLNPTISMAFDSTKFSYVSCSVAGAVNNGNSISFSISNLKAFHSGSAVFNFNIKPATPLGILIIATANLVSGSVNVHNTYYTVSVGSFDPNEKDATPELSTTQLSNGE